MLRQLFRPTKRHRPDKNLEMYRHIIRREAEIGGRLFGPLPTGGRREFFCLDEHNWVWHEEWTDTKGTRQTKTTRYYVTSDGIFKSQDGQARHKVIGQEAENFETAAKLYVEQVHAELYNFAQ